MVQLITVSVLSISHLMNIYKMDIKLTFMKILDFI